MQKGLDLLMRRDRIILQMFKHLSPSRSLGTMVQECFGVPVLRSYSKTAMRRLFSDFEVLELGSFGLGLPIANSWNSENPTSLGSFWYIEAKKPSTQSLSRNGTYA